MGGWGPAVRRRGRWKEMEAVGEARGEKGAELLREVPRGLGRPVCSRCKVPG